MTNGRAAINVRALGFHRGRLGKVCARILVASGVLVSLLPAAETVILARWNFEGATPFQNLSIEGDPPAVVADPRNPSNRVMRSVLPRGDDRSEVRWGRIPEGEERWVGCRIYRPHTDQPDGVCTFQLGPISGAPGRNGRGLYQIIAREVGPTLQWYLRGFTERIEGTPGINQLLGPVTPRAWDDWVLHIKLRRDAQGLIEVWRNGEKVFHHLGQNAYEGDSIPIKWGAYIGSGGRSDAEIHVYYDDIVVGNAAARYEDVAPDGRSPTAPRTNFPSARAIAPGQILNLPLAASGRPWTSWSASGLPAWLHLHQTTGVLSGQVPATWTAPVTTQVSVTNAFGTATSPLILAPEAQVLPTLVTTTVFTGRQGQPVRTGTTGPLFWSLTNPAFSSTSGYQRPFWVRYHGLPAGLTGTQECRVSGTPTVPGRYQVVVEAENDYGYRQGLVLMEIQPANGSATLPTLSPTTTRLDLPR